MSIPTPNNGFVEAIRTGDRSRLASVPKADRHCHSLFGCSLQSISKWVGKPIGSPPARMADLDEMKNYAHSELYAYIRSRDGFEFTAETSILEAIQDGVSILEMSLDADLLRLYDSRATGFIDFVSELVGKHNGDISFRPEIGISKDRDPFSQAILAMECIESKVFKSIDLYGNELAQQPEAYTELFKRAKRFGLKLKAHVGEFGDAPLVERTLRTLELDEIQHGVAVATSQPLMDMIRKEDIRLNVCPSSNVALSVVDDIAHHPIRTLVQNGVRVSINSDDKMIFGMSATDEYLALYKAGTLSEKELDMIRLDSLSD